MNIVLFQDITTDTNLEMLERAGKKYTGLYVDMDNKEERKYVKDNAQLIGGMIKKLDRARIDKARDYKTKVEKEAGDIKQRLEAANLPFTLLIDEHKAKRAKILAEEKAKVDAAALALQIEADHESAIMMDKIQTIEKAEREQAQKERDDQIAKEAREQAENQAVIDKEQAVQQERDRAAAEKRAEEEAQKRRKANRAHVSEIRRQAKESLMEYGLDEDHAKSVVMAINAGVIQNVTINY